MTAMILSQIHSQPNFLQAIEIAVNILRGVIQKSLVEPLLLGMEEINIIASKSIIENPDI